MSNLQLFRDFINERLAAAAMEIFGYYEETVAEWQEEIRRTREKNAQLQRMLDIQPEIKLHRTDILEFSVPEPLQIKEEQELWTIQVGEHLQELQSDTTASIFPSPREKTHWDAEDSAQLPPLDQTPTVENRGIDFLTTNTTEVQNKAESDEEDSGAPEPASDSQPPSVIPDCPTAPSLEKEIELLPGDRTVARTLPGTESEDSSTGETERKTAEKPYQCEECEKTYTRSSSLVKHRRVHSGVKPYQCEECGKDFKHKYRLVSHRRVHSGVKAYQCEECDKAFKHNNSLVSHRRVHSGVAPYQCEECDKAYYRMSHLVDHRRIHSSEKPYQCEECDKAFKHRSQLVDHRKIHSGEKPYQCEECEKAFYRKGHLVDHRRIHSGEKPYVCEECDKAFKHNNSLVNHRRIHSGEKLYQW